MPKGYRSNQDFSRGLQTKAVEDGLPLPEFTTFSDVRVGDGSAAPRKGMVRLARGASTITALDFVSTSSEYLSAEVDPRVWALGTQFTLEILLNIDSKANANPVIHVGTSLGALVIDTGGTANKWRVRVWDSANTPDTIQSSSDAVQGSATHLAVIRDGATLTLYVDGTSEGTATMDADNLLRTPAGNIQIGSSGANYLDGTIDYVRCVSYARTNQADRYMRWVDGRAQTVLCNYNMDLTGNLVYDTSRFENTLEKNGTPDEVTALAGQSPGVDGIFQYRDADNVRQVVICHGGQYVHAEV